MKGGSSAVCIDGEVTCWLSRYDDRRGVPLIEPAGGVFGGVGSPPCGMKESPNVRIECVIVDCLGGTSSAGVVINSTKGAVPSTMTMDLLPRVIPISLEGPDLC
jgi:hypothetical protein